MANRSLPIWQVMIWSAGGFARRGKGQDFLFLLGFLHSLPRARRFAALGCLLGIRADGVHRSRGTRLYLRLARDRSSAPSDVFRKCSPAVQISSCFSLAAEGSMS